MQRKVNIELLRVISMLMIVALHFFYNTGALLELNVINFNFGFAWLIEAISYTSVNSFILITGYFCFGNTRNFKKIINLIFIIVFYCIVFFILGSFISPNLISLEYIIKSIFPLISGHYWFVTTYILLYIFYPFINRVINNLNKKQHLQLIFISVVCFSVIPSFFPFADINIALNGGTNLVWFIVLYITGAYFRIYPVEIKARKAIITSFIFILSVFITKILIWSITKKIIGHAVASSNFYHHNSILIYLANVFLFIGVLKIRINNKIITSIILTLSKLSFGVYIIHENIYVKNIVWSFIKNYQNLNSKVWPIFSILSIIIVYIGCCIIEMIRINIFKIIKLDICSKFLYSNLKGRYNRIIENLNKKI